MLNNSEICLHHLSIFRHETFDGLISLISGKPNQTCCGLEKYIQQQLIREQRGEKRKGGRWGMGQGSVGKREGGRWGSGKGGGGEGRRVRVGGYR